MGNRGEGGREGGRERKLKAFVIVSREGGGKGACV